MHNFKVYIDCRNVHLLVLTKVLIYHNAWNEKICPIWGLHKIMFCLGLSYIKGATPGHSKQVLSMKTKCQVPLFESVNPFLYSATNLSVYLILIIMPQVLHIFAP